MPGYRFLEGVVTADLAFEAQGKDLEELFTNAAMALFDAQVKLETVEPKIIKKGTFENENLEQLLYDFLEQIIFLKDAEQLLFKTVKVKIIKNKAYKLEAEFKGEKIDIKKHELGNDLKAVTWHKFKIEQTPKGWLCQIVIDI